MEERSPGGVPETEGGPESVRPSLLVEHAPDMLVALDARGVVLVASPSFRRVLGHGEGAGESLLTSPPVHPEDLRAVRAFLDAALRRPDTDVTGEFRLRHADGAYRTMEAVGRGVLATTGPGNVIVSVRDITERELARRELALQSRLARLGAEIAEAITLPGDMRGRVQRCAEALARHLGVAVARIWTLDEGWGVLVLQASAGEDTRTDDVEGHILVGAGEVGRIALERRPRLTNAATDGLGVGGRTGAGRDDLTAFAGHPLIVEERLVGVVALFDTPLLGEEMLGALTAVADRIALGIDRKRIEEDLHRSVDALLVLHESGRILGSSLDPDALAPGLLGIARRVAGVDAAVLSLKDEAGGMVVRYREGPEELWRRVREAPEGRAAYARAIERGQPEGVRVDVSGPDPLRLAAWYVPLRAHGETVGVLEAYGSPSLETDEAVEILLSLASQAANALENARLYGALTERERRLQDLVRKLLTAQEEERKRVSREVHDDIAQTAVAVYQHLQAYAHAHGPRTPQARRELEQIQELARCATRDARRVIADLRPTELDDHGLVAAIRQQLEPLRSEGWRADLEENLGGERLPPMVETVLLRVVQEALRNARKHARTDVVSVELVRTTTLVRFEVRDRGRGFRPEEVSRGTAPGERVGIEGMRERVHLLGGALEIRSAPGEGTAVVARVPLAPEGEADG